MNTTTSLIILKKDMVQALNSCTGTPGCLARGKKWILAEKQLNHCGGWIISVSDTSKKTEKFSSVVAKESDRVLGSVFGCAVPVDQTWAN